MFGITISWWTIGGLLLAGVGCFVAFFLLRGLRGGIIRVPDGIAPDVFYRKWRATSLKARMTRGFIFTLFLSIGVILSGCGVAIWGMSK